MACLRSVQKICNANGGGVCFLGGALHGRGSKERLCSRYIFSVRSLKQCRECRQRSYLLGLRLLTVSNALCPLVTNRKSDANSLARSRKDYTWATYSLRDSESTSRSQMSLHISTVLSGLDPGLAVMRLRNGT